MPAQHQPAVYIALVALGSGKPIRRGRGAAFVLLHAERIEEQAVGRVLTGIRQALDVVIRPCNICDDYLNRHGPYQ